MVVGSTAKTAKGRLGFDFTRTSPATQTLDLLGHVFITRQSVRALAIDLSDELFVGTNCWISSITELCFVNYERVQRIFAGHSQGFSVAGLVFVNESKTFNFYVPAGFAIAIQEKSRMTAATEGTVCVRANLITSTGARGAFIVIFTGFRCFVELISRFALTNIASGSVNTSGLSTVGGSVTTAFVFILACLFAVFVSCSVSFGTGTVIVTYSVITNPNTTPVRIFIALVNVTAYAIHKVFLVTVPTDTSGIAESEVLAS